MENLWILNAARFFSNVKVGTSGQCWPWLGKIAKIHKSGIFRFKTGGKIRNLAPHTVSWILHFGEIAGNEHMLVASCGNIHCCNPGHLTKQAKSKAGRTLACYQKEEMLKRFWSKVDKKSEADCWVWMAGRSKFGHGIWYKRNSENKRVHVGAHRWIFYEMYPKTDPKAFICHHCDVPECVNPSHLYAGSAQTNIADCCARKRRFIAAGESHPSAKLTKRQVQSVLAARKKGTTLASLASRFGVSEGCISMIVTGRNWKSLLSGA